MIYKEQFLKEISFPLGGIGTGSIGLGGDGRLIDWEIFNKPRKGSFNRSSHFAIRAINGEEITAAVLNGDLMKDYHGQYCGGKATGYGLGPFWYKMYGFPHFKNLHFNGEFPIATLSFQDEAFPGNVVMTAFNPFIPLDAKNSSIPAAFFEFDVKNTTDKEIKYQIALSVSNPYVKSLNKSERKDGYQTIMLFNNAVDRNDVTYGDLTIATDCDVTYTQTYWYRGSFSRDDAISFWNTFSGQKDIKERIYDNEGKNDTATLIAEVDVCPGETKKAKFIISWNVPNNFNYWEEQDIFDVKRCWKNYYATVFENSMDTAIYALRNWNSLYQRTLKFKEALHQSTLPRCVIDAASANLSVLKSPTVLRLEDGAFYGWEGVSETQGLCEGTCQHVWNYAYALCFLFPELERSIREMEFKYNTDQNGKMGFRILLPLGREKSSFRACLDGQMGAVLKCYREWRISGDNNWLKSNWDNIKKVLEYAWSEENEDYWDLDKDGVLEGRQHHTLDMELFGPSSWLEGMYLAALKAAGKMAEFCGDAQKAIEYRDLFQKGFRWANDNLFNGKYFIQKIDVSDKNITDRFRASAEYWNEEVHEIKYQISQGSSIDQLLAQWHADIIGLGDIFEQDKIQSALSYMMQHNYKPTMRNFTNTWRIFSVNDEAGSIICDYAEGVKKPEIPIPYYTETMTGFEYAFAGLLYSRGKTEDGLKVVKAVRDRFDGEKRNPWNEFECGSNYARSMASYALVPILSGFEFDMPNNHIGFQPYIKGDFRCVWSLADAWGNFVIDNDIIKISICEGVIKLKSLGLKFCDHILCLKIDGETVDFEFENGIISFKGTCVSNFLEIQVQNR